MKDYTPAIGDIVWLDFSPTLGHEQAGRRPALVVSTTVYNTRAGLAVVCPMTTKAKGYPFEVAMPDGAVVLADQVRSIDVRSRRPEFKAKAPAGVLKQTQTLLRTLLAL